jgi:hypothetical protein
MKMENHTPRNKNMRRLFTGLFAVLLILSIIYAPMVQALTGTPFINTYPNPAAGEPEIPVNNVPHGSGHLMKVVFLAVYSDGEVPAYCLNYDKTDPGWNTISGEFDIANTYDPATVTGLKSLLLHGYPYVTGGLNDKVAQLLTQYALYTYLHDQGYASSSGGVGYPWPYSQTEMSSKLTSASYTSAMVNYFNAVVDAGKHPSFPNFQIDVTPSELTLTNDGSAYVGTVTIKLTDLTSYTIDKSKLPLGVDYTGYTGKDGDILTFNVPLSYAGNTLPLNDLFHGHDARADATLHAYKQLESYQQDLLVIISDPDAVAVAAGLTLKAPNDENPTPTPSETPIETPTPSPGETPSQPPTETPTPSPGETPSQPPIETPPPSPGETPSQPPTETPAPSPGETPSQPPIETPTPSPGETPSQPPTETPTPSPGETPSQPPTGTPAPSPGETPSQPPIETPSPSPTPTPTPYIPPYSLPPATSQTPPPSVSPTPSAPPTSESPSAPPTSAPPMTQTPPPSTTTPPSAPPSAAPVPTPPSTPNTPTTEQPPVPNIPGDKVVPSDDGYIEFDEDGTPKGEWHWDDNTGEWIYDEYPPLGEMPRTGDAGVAVYVPLLLGSVVTLVIVALTDKKKSGTAK